MKSPKRTWLNQRTLDAAWIAHFCTKSIHNTHWTHPEQIGHDVRYAGVERQVKVTLLVHPGRVIVSVHDLTDEQDLVANCLANFLTQQLSLWTTINAKNAPPHETPIKLLHNGYCESRTYVSYAVCIKIIAMWQQVDSRQQQNIFKLCQKIHGPTCTCTTHVKATEQVRTNKFENIWT